MMHPRTGAIVWLSDVKSSRGLEKYGSLHYVSRKMRYAVLYMDADRFDDISRTLTRLPYVKRVERSLRHEIRTEYSKDAADKTRFYTY